MERSQVVEVDGFYGDFMNCFYVLIKCFFMIFTNDLVVIEFKKKKKM